MWLDFDREKVPRLREPAMVVAVSTSMPQYRALYSQARELGEYLLKTLQFEKIATVRSSAFPPEVLVGEDGISALPECHFYLKKGKKDLILFAGDASPMEDQYGFAHFLLEYAEELGVGELYSVGTRWAENPVPPEADPVPNGFATDAIGVAKLKKAGVSIIKEEPAPFFASMVVALSKDYGIRGYKLSVDHGEPIPHARSVAKLLGAFSSLSGIEVPLEGLGVKPGQPVAQRQPGDATIYH
ncbi:MAG TPA: PAC2 family protein [Nitrososphaerales archaeon]|nr:PAC2 family protein [Nitrososphaerales archaeon]